MGSGMRRTLTHTGLLLCLCLGAVAPGRAGETVPPEAWGLRAYEAAALVEVTGFPECPEDGGACVLRTWTLTAPVLLDAGSRMLLAVPAGALANALRVTLRLPGETAARDAFQVPVPLRFGVAVLGVGGTLPEQAADRLPPVAGGWDGADTAAPPPAKATPIWILLRTPGVPDAPARTVSGHLVPPAPPPGRAVQSFPVAVETGDPLPEGGGVVCDDRGRFLGLRARLGEGWILVPARRVGEALTLAAGAVRSGAAGPATARNLADGVLGAWSAYTAFRATGGAGGPVSDVVVDGAETTLATGPRRLLEAASCRAQRAWRGLVDARTDQNADHVELLGEYWEWIQSPGFRTLQSCLARETGTTVLLSCFACHPPSPHRAMRQSPSSLFTEDLYFRLVDCDEVGTRRFCAECLLYERYEDLLIHSGFEDERLRRLLPFVRRIDREVFRHRLEPACEAGDDAEHPG
jgi:hypothetical protein